MLLHVPRQEFENEGHFNPCGERNSVLGGILLKQGLRPIWGSFQGKGGTYARK